MATRALPMNARSPAVSDPSELAEKEALRIGQTTLFDVGFEAIEIRRGKHHADAVEGFSGATLFAVQLLHPAMQIGMLSPVMQLAVRVGC